MSYRKCHKITIKHFGASGGVSSSSGSSKPIAPGTISYATPLLQNIQQQGAKIPGIQVPQSVNDQALWNLQQRRFLEGARPGMAARGLLTSGPAQAAENQGLSDMAAQFSSQEFQRALQGAQFQQTGQMGYVSSMLDALKAILGQTTTQKSSSSAINAGLSVAPLP